MSTIDAWSKETFAALADPEQLGGAIYPMLGSEWVWLSVAVVFWLAWHFRTSAGETEEQAELASQGHTSDSYKQNASEW